MGQVLDDSALFNPEYKETIRKALLRDEEFARYLFGGMAKLSGEDTKAYRETLDNIRNDSSEEREEVNTSEIIETILDLLFKIGHRLHESETLHEQFMEMVIVNSIEMKRDLMQLTAALASSDIEKSTSLQLAEKLELEQDLMVKAVQEAKTLKSVSKWWGKRLEDMKGGDPLERI
jgi:hypothetical protein